MALPRRIKGVLASLLLMTLLGAWATAQLSAPRAHLIPTEKSHIRSSIYVASGAETGPKATVSLRRNTTDVVADFNLPSAASYPFATLGITLDETQPNARLMDWSTYSAIVLTIKCAPANTLIFALHTEEPGITDPKTPESYRPAHEFFDCNEQGNKIQINFANLATPIWWIEEYQLNAATEPYHLNKVRAFDVINSFQSPRDVQSTITISEAVLIGEDFNLIYRAIAIGVIAWGCVGIWLWMSLAARRSPPQQHHVELDGRQVERESKHHRTTNNLLHFLADQYMNPDLTLELTAVKLGINRTKINQLLREESGLTFAGYLNRLRLREAARLLTEKRMGVAETAYAVGFGNVSYFNRAFKKEYGCSPLAYKKVELLPV
jgi:AraC-like DNA-binding protein